MLAEPVAGALNLDNDSVVEEAIEQCGGDHGIAEDLTPFREATIGGQDHGAAFVTGVDELKEQIATARNDDVAQWVDDIAVRIDGNILQVIGSFFNRICRCLKGILHCRLLVQIGRAHV